MTPALERRLHGAAYLALQKLRGRPVGPFIRQLQQWERLDRAAFRRLGQELLERTLAYAHRSVPLYSSGPWRAALSHADPMRIEAWPVLERQLLRTHQQELLARPRPRGAFFRHSSASTGAPVYVAYDPQAGAWSWANEYRAMLWYGVAPGARTLMLWGIHHPLLDWIRNYRTYLTFELTPERLEQAARYVMRRRPELCVALPSAGAQLARYIAANHGRPWWPLVPFVKLGGEQIYPFEREQIEAGLGARVVASYGCAEVGAIAMECPAGSMHVFSEHVHLEVFAEDRPLPAGELGDLVVTSLVNRAMPLVRCRIGDRGRLSPDPCRCGLPHPVITDLLGRTADMFLAADGRTLVHGSVLGAPLAAFLARAPAGAVRQVLFQQINSRWWTVLVEAGAGFDEPIARELAGIVHEAFGRDCHVEIEKVAVIPRERSGKYRYYRSGAAPAASASASAQLANPA